MVTTAQPILDELASMLNETSTDTSVKRLRYFNRAVRHVVGMYKFSWARKKYDMVLVASTQEYNLTSALTDYNPTHGVYELWNGTTMIDPIDYGQRDGQSGQFFYLTPDNKSIGFTQTIAGTEDYDLWYYQQHTSVSAAETTLNIYIPEQAVRAVALYMKHLVHEGKRQRNDSRNAILDFQEAMDDLRPAELSRKARHLPRTIANPLAYTGFTRTYDY